MGFSYELAKELMNKVAEESLWLTFLEVENLSFGEVLKERISVKGCFSVDEDEKDHVHDMLYQEHDLRVYNSKQIKVSSYYGSTGEMIRLSKKGLLYFAVSKHKYELSFLFVGKVDLDIDVISVQKEEGDNISFNFGERSLVLVNTVNKDAINVHCARTHWENTEKYTEE